MSYHYTRVPWIELTLPMAEARGFSRPAGEAHRASAPAPAGSALRDGSAPPEADDGCGGGMVRRASHEATAAARVAQTQEAALSPRLKPGACAPQEKVMRGWIVSTDVCKNVAG